MHGLDARSYRERFGIPARHPLTARTMTAIRKQIARQSKPWEKAPTYLKAHPQVTPPVVKKTRVKTKQVPEKGTSRTKK
jgi:hypothetical protein